MGKITLACPDDLLEWLEKHPSINRSGLFQEVVSRLKNKEKAVLEETDIEAISGKFESAQAHTQEAPQ